MISRVIRDFETFAAMGRKWDALLEESGAACVFLTHAWLCSWWRHLSAGAELWVLIGEDERGNLRGAAPLVRRGHRIEFMASREVSDYGGFLSAPGHLRELVEALFFWMEKSSDSPSGLRLINIPEGASVLKHLSDQAGEEGLECRISEGDIVPGMKLPGDYPGYLAGLGRKRRHELIRKLKHADTLPDRSMVRRDSPEELDPFVEIFMERHRSSGPEKRRFWEFPGMRDFFRDMSRSFAERGWLELLLLYSGDRPVAGLMSFLYAGRICFFNTAFDPEFASFRPGYYLFDQAIRGALSRGLGYVDFLRGGERYKFEFGARSHIIYDLDITPTGCTG